jgi:hypothetical protein
MLFRPRAIFVTAVTVSIFGCSPGGSSGAAGTPECRSTCSASACGGKCPSGEQVTLGDFKIDAKQVTRREYETFASINIPFQATAHCTQDAPDWRESLADPSDLPGLDEPMTSVTWCQAAAYCKWAEKRLCGRLGGGPLSGGDLTSTARAQKDEWYAACGSGDVSLEGLPLAQHSEWLNGYTTLNGASGAIVAMAPGCSEWTTIDQDAGGCILGFRCCADP